MSKLAHSNEETMSELERQWAIETGNEDLIPAISPPFVKWLRELAKEGGRGVVGNIDARCLGRVADLIEKLHNQSAIAWMTNVGGEQLYTRHVMQAVAWQGAGYEVIALCPSLRTMAGASQ